MNDVEDNSYFDHSGFDWGLGVVYFCDPWRIVNYLKTFYISSQKKIDLRGYHLYGIWQTGS